MEPEYAPQYTFKERLRHIAVLLPIGAGLYLAYEWWFLPNLRAFSDHAVCEVVFGVSGLSILLYGLFVFMPLSFGIVTAGVYLPTAVRSIKTQRYPPLGKKVYRPTRIKTGRRAVASALAPLVIAVVFIGIAVWGYDQAGQFLERAYAAHPNGWQKCAANSSLRRTPPTGRR